MTRYQPIPVHDVHDGQALRVTLRHQKSHGTIVIEDKVEHVVIEEIPAHQGVLGGTIPAKQVVAGMRFPGFFAAYDKPCDGWEISLIERALPPLPTVPGSVVLVDGKTAVLREDPEYPDGDPEWVWAHNALIGPTDEQLFRADILHEARR